LKIVQDEQLVGKLSDKVMFITSVSSGIGIETLRAFHATGATIYGSVRSLSKGQKVVDEILAADPSNKAKIELIEIDLESFESIRKGAEEFLGKESKLMSLSRTLVSWRHLKAAPRMVGRRSLGRITLVTFSCSSC
jgi:NAD(P)-dependent dehydrogenase (short-subunit alcohol dehydrogenase family)